MTSPKRVIITSLVCLVALFAVASTSEAGSIGCNRYSNGAVAPAGTLRAAPGQAYFTEYNTATGVTEPRFLGLLAYFGAMRPGHDPTPIFNILCNADFNGVRIFADFWISNAYCPGGYLNANDAVIRVDGTLNPTRLAQLKAVLTAARNAGLVVDLSFGHEVVQGRTFEAHRQGMGRLANELNSPQYDHVMFDVQNEFDWVGCPTRQDWSTSIGGPNGAVATALTGFPTAAADPNRVVFASSSEGNHLSEASAVFSGGGKAIAVHESRNPWNENTPLWSDMASAALSGGVHVPIYAQEPERWTPSNGVTSFDLFIAGRNAKVRGAAAWTFHTEALFFPTNTYPYGPWGTPEFEFLGVVPANPSWTMWNVLIDDCWGYLAPAGWMMPICP